LVHSNIVHILGFKIVTMNMLDDFIRLKLDKLQDLLRTWNRFAIAFSGGVDSSLLLKVAHDLLGKNVLAIYCDSPLQASSEKIDAAILLNALGVKCLKISFNKLDHEAFRINPQNRCYYCKALIFDEIIKAAKSENIEIIADGSNFDDLSDYRPGAKALFERNIKSPLQDVKLTKEEIRALSSFFGLPNWDKDAMACLATRIPFGEEINSKKLSAIDQAEAILIKIGFRNVRTRHFGDLVKIEVRADQVNLLRSDSVFKKVVNQIKLLGFKYIEVASDGYQQGRMNKKL
jgi:pyridinium-3,5-biscarboxylic acid mononucleotide sulfurtransferase